MRPRYPSLDQVDDADRLQICIWYSKLPKPKVAKQKAIFGRVAERYFKFGGYTQEILDHIERRWPEAQRPAPPAKKDQQRKSGPHKKTKQFLNDWYAIYPREKEFQRASKAKLTRWIADLQRDLRRGRTKSGRGITPAERPAIEKYIGQLKQRRADLVPPKKIKDIRSELAAAFMKTGIYGKPKGNSQDAETFITEKLKRARKSVRKARPD
jgi:hypothetical protein